MKKFCALAIGLLAMPVLAQDRAIQDIMYLPKAGTFYGASTLAGLTGKVKSDESTTDIGGFVLQQDLGYSFSDTFSLEVGANYTQINRDYKYDDQSDDSSETKGVSDPTLTARFRAVESTLRLDIVGGALIGMGDTQYDKHGDSDNLQGGYELFLGVELGGSLEGGHQWAVGATLTQHQKSTSDYADEGGDYSETDDAHKSGEFKLAFLTKLTDAIFLLPNVGAEFTEGYDFESEAGSEGEVTSVTRYRAGSGLRWVLSPDLMLEGSLDYFKVNTAVGQISRFDYWTYGAGATYQF